MPSNRTLTISLVPCTFVALGTGLVWARGGEACRQAAQREAFGDTPRFVASAVSPYPVGPMAGRPVVGDVNGDSRPDIVVACGTCCGSRPDDRSGHIVVLLGDGAGSFKPAPATPIKVGSSVRKVALGDLTGDKILDIVAAEHDSHNLTLLIGDGNGGFNRRVGDVVCVMNGPIRNPSTGAMVMPEGHTHEVATADINDDGRLDILATTVSGHGLAALLNQTDGSFTHSAGSPYRLRTPYDAIATADMNGDDKNDIVFPSIAGNEIHVMLGDGKGGFLPADGSPMKVAERPGYVAVGDCNNDGKPDVFATHDDAAMVDVLFNDGTGKLSVAPDSPIKPAVRGGLWGIATADLNGDGTLDLACGNAAGDGLAILLGNGRGGFLAVDSGIQTGDGPGYLAAADLNGDGRIDLVTGNYDSGDLTILLAQGK
jgi:hypothetical protein